MSAQGLGSRAIIGEFYARLEAAPGMEWVDAVSMLFSSDQGSETYKWLGQSPAMREWVGERQAKGFRENGITIANQHYEAMLEVLVEELRRDKTGQILTRVRELADRANSHWASLLSTLILNGESTICYDGQYFFDTDHAEGDSGSQSNDISVDISTIEASPDTPSSPTVLQMQGTILRAVQQILGFKDDQGEPMNEFARNFLVMGPVSLWNQMAAATRNPIVGAGATNTIVNLDGYAIRAAANPRLTWTDKIAVFRTDGNVKPFIRQQETEVTVDAIAEGSEEEIKNKRHLYGVQTWRNVGYGYWQHACLATMT